MIIGITGTDGAGKGEVVAFLVEHFGFAHFSSRELIVAEIEKRGLENTRPNMREVANAMREEKGAGVIVEVALEKIKAGRVEKAIIESIRNLQEVETLKKAGGILLAVDASQKVRYDRVVNRGGSTDNVSFTEFVAQEEKEMNDENPNGLQKAKVIALADYTIKNDSTLAELHAKIKKWLDV